jgi:dTDP-4-dehydrorhamnose reductase
MSKGMTGSILVLGGGGMLGHKIFQNLCHRFPEIRCTFRNQPTQRTSAVSELFPSNAIITGVDASRWSDLEALLVKLKPAVLINCIGIVKQRSEAKTPLVSIEINSLLPHRLAILLASWQGRLIHFSTDCVFSGRKGNYSEGDFSDAEDLYGRTKYLGEVIAPNALTLRSSIIGRELTNRQSLLEWLLQNNGGHVKGYCKAIYSGVTTLHLANLVGDLILRHESLSGLYQVASTPISKYDLLILLRNAYGLHIEIEPDDHFFCDRSLNPAKFAAATGYRCPPWTELVRELAEDPTRYD